MCESKNFSPTAIRQAIIRHEIIFIQEVFEFDSSVGLEVWADELGIRPSVLKRMIHTPDKFLLWHAAAIANYIDADIEAIITLINYQAEIQQQLNEAWQAYIKK